MIVVCCSSLFWRNSICLNSSGENGKAAEKSLVFRGEVGKVSQKSNYFKYSFRGFLTVLIEK